MAETGRELNPAFIGKTAERLAVVYVQELNNFFASLGEEGEMFQLNPNTAAKDFVPALQKVIDGAELSSFPAILLIALLESVARDREARGHAEYDADAIAAELALIEITSFINRQDEEVKKRWRRLNLVDFLLPK